MFIFFNRTKLASETYTLMKTERGDIMRNGELCYIETCLDKGAIKLYSDDPMELEYLLATTYGRIREIGFSDLFDILTIAGAKVNSDDLDWILLDTDLDAYLSWTIECKPNNDIGYKYVATMTGFRKIEES